MADSKPSWQPIADARRSKINNAIPASHRIPPAYLERLADPKNVIGIPDCCGILTQREIDITSTSSATKLLEDIRNRVYTSVEVTTAFCKRASIAHQLTNCLAEVLYDVALTRAQELDDYLNSTGEVVGPLHGLPISVKDHIFMSGSTSTSALITFADFVPDTDAHIVEIFRKAGAVFYVKTANPQGVFSMETESNLFGKAVNPYNTDLSPGGSSGGEGALIALRGSLLGVGTDIGGSVRLPAAWCGFYSLKPSIARTPNSGVEIFFDEGVDYILGVIGPMARSLDDLELYCKVALANEPWLVEPSLVNKPWQSNIAREDSVKGPLTIGLLISDGIVDPHPPIVRSLQETARALEAAGHKVIPWEPLFHKEIVEVITAMFFIDGGNKLRALLKKGGEEPSFFMAMVLSFAGTPGSIEQGWKLNRARNNLRTAYAKRWNETKVDAILCPNAATASAIHRTSLHSGYTAVWNLLDYAAVAFPAGRVHETDGTVVVPPEASTAPKGDMSNFTSNLWYEKDEHGNVLGTSKYKYAPVGLQLVARRFEEEKALAMARIVVDARKRAGMEEY